MKLPISTPKQTTPTFFPSTGASSSSSGTSSESVASPFLNSATPQEKLLHFLYSKGVIDKTGRLTDQALTSKEIPLDEIQKQALTDLLDQEINVAVYDRSFKTTLTQLFEYIQKESTTEIPRIEIVGGFVRKLLLLSTDFVVKSLSTLTSIPEEEIRPFITDELLQERERTIPDIDVRIHAPTAKKDDLFAFTNSVVKYFSENLNMDPYSVQQGAFSKFNAVYDKKNQFSIATFQPKGEKVPEIELLFVKNFLRNHLFVHDSLRILLGKTPSIEGDFLNGWQSLIDLLTRVVHIVEPKTVDLFGFPTLISYFSRGYVLEDQEALEILIKKVTTLSQYHVGIPGQIVGLLSTSLQNHHPDDPNAAIVLTFNACSHLNLSPLEMREIWNQMAERHWIRGLGISDPLLKEIDETIREKKIPFKKVMRAIALRAHLKGDPTRTHCNKEAYQLPIASTGLKLLLPCNALESVTAVEKFLTKSKTSKPLLHLIGTNITLGNQELEEKALFLLDSERRACRYLGYLFLLKGGGPLEPLLTHFIDIYTFVKEEDRNLISSALDQIIGQPITTSLPEESSAITLMNCWITELAKSQNSALAQSALKLWDKYNEKIPTKQRKDTEKLLIKVSLVNRPHKALDLFEKSEPIQQTFSQLASILSRINQDQHFFKTSSEKLSGILCQFLTKEHKDSAPAPFYPLFSSYIHSLIADDQQIHARTLLELASTNASISNSNQEIQNAWLSLTQSSFVHPEDALKIWEKGETLKLWKRTPPVLETHLSLIDHLFQNVPTRGAAVRHLKAVAKEGSEHPKIQELAVRHIKGLIEKGKSEKAINRLTEFKAHLSKDQTAEIRELLYNLHMQKQEYLEASALWPLLKNQSPEHLHNLLEVLTAQHVKEPLLKAATYLFTTGATDELLTVDQQITYLLSIYKRSPTRRFLGYLLKKTKDADLTSENCYAFAQHLISGLNDEKNVSAPLRSAILQRVPDICSTLQKSGTAENYTDFYKGLDTHEIPYIKSLEFQHLCTSQVTHYNEIQENECTLTWINRSLSIRDPVFLSEWGPKLLAMLEPEIKAQVFSNHQKLFALYIKSQLYLSTFIEIFEQKRLSAALLLDYLDLNPSDDPTPWLSLMNHCDKKEFTSIWKKFTSWHLCERSVNERHQQCWIKGIDRIEKEKHPLSLFAWIPKKTDPHWVLDSLFPPKSKERLDLCHLLLKVSANEPIDLKRLNYFFDWVHAQYHLTEHPERLLIIVANIIERLKNLSDIYFEYACCLTNLCLIYLDGRPESLRNEIYQQFLSLISLGKDRDSNDDIVEQLLATTKSMQKDFPEILNLTQVAATFATYRSQKALHSTDAFLLECPESDKKNLIYSILIPSMLRYNFDLKDKEGQLGALSYIYKNLTRLDQFPDILNDVTDIGQSLIVKQLDSKLTFNYFCAYFMKALSPDQESEKAFTISFEKLFRYSSDMVPILTYSDKTESNTAVRANLFKQMHSIIEKILDRKAELTEEEIYIHHFLQKNIFTLFQSFPKKRKPLVNLLDRYIFRYTPDGSSFYYDHLKQADELQMSALRFGIYENQLDKAVESIYYINRKTIRAPGFPATKQTEILQNVITRTLAFNTPSATLIALQIMKGAQQHILPSNDKTIITLYTKIISKISQDPFFIHDENTLFELTLLTLMNHPYILKAINPRTTLDLYSKLFNEVYSIYQNPQLSNVPNQAKLLEWLAKFLIRTHSFKGLDDNKSAPKYFEFSQCLVVGILENFPRLSIKQRLHVSALISKLIIWDGDNESRKLSRKIKDLRCKLAKQWVEGLLKSDFSHYANKEFKTLSDSGVFTEHRKEFKSIHRNYMSQEKKINTHSQAETDP